MKHEPYDSKMNWNRLNKKLYDEHIIANLFLKPIPLNTIFYTHSKTKEKIRLAAESNQFMFGRTGVEKYNEINDIDYYLLKSFTIYNDSLPNIEKFSSIIENSKGKWGILMYHHIVPDTASVRELYKKHNIINTYAVTPETFDVQMNIISNKNYWISTIYEIGIYLLQRENSNLIINIENNITFVTIECDLDPEIYNHEMTMIYNGKTFNVRPNVKTKL